jgi:DNA-binding transcriptional regulator YiaG
MADNNESFGDALIGALEEAVAYERGELPVARVDRVEITARHARVPPPPAYPPERVRAIRHQLSVSQQVFAELLNASASAVRAWEQGAREPDGPTRRLLQLAERHPDVLTELLTGESPYPLREHTGVMIAAEPRIPYGIPRNPSGRK